MRCCLLLPGLAGLLILGCQENAQPRANRSASASIGNAERRATAGNASGADAAPAAGAGEPLNAIGGTVRLEAITLTAPESWARKQPRSSFILAEFVLRRAEGDDVDGRLTVSTAGGSVEANIDRWKSQFRGAVDNPREERIDAGGVQVTLVDLAGEFNDQPGPFAPAVQRPGYRMIAAIIPVNDQLHFVKAVGPQKTIAAHAEAIKAFVRTVKRIG